MKKKSGIVTLVARNGQITSFEAVGLQNVEHNVPMQKNTIFRIQSMSKPFAAAAKLMLAEEEKLQLDDPVEKYLPEFTNIWLVSEMTAEKAKFMHGRSGSRGDDPRNLVLYASKDVINWDRGVFLNKVQKGVDCYSGNSVIGKDDSSTPERLLIQSSIVYSGSRVNLKHWWVENISGE